MRRSEEMPFSRSRTSTASTISLDIPSALQQVAPVDVRVRNRDDAAVGGHYHLDLARPDQLAGEASPPAMLLTCTHARATTYEASEVIGLRERTLGAGRRDLESEVHEQVAEMVGDALAERVIHSRRMINHDTHCARRHALGEQHLDVGLGARKARLDL